MSLRILFRAIGVVILPNLVLCSGLSASLANDTRSILQEWVQVRTLISEEREHWAAEQDDLADTINLLRAEKAMLEEQIAAREAAAAEATDARSLLAERREELDKQAAELAGLLTEHETMLKTWVPTLPGGLQQEISPLIRRLPQNAEAAHALGLARRLQSVVGILSQADRFNSTLAFRRELRTDPDNGSQQETDTLYFGLAFALFSDPEGNSAGIGRPGPDGWTWESARENANAIRQLMAVYRSEVRAAYVPVPIIID